MKKLLLVIVIIVFVFAILYVFKNNKPKGPPHPIIQKISQNFSLIKPEYRDIPIYQGDSSYTENKNVITLCLKDPDHKSYYDMNTLMYVALHELAHVITTTIGHDENFKKNFSKLLIKAERLGLYNPNIPLPKKYCGVENI